MKLEVNKEVKEFPNSVCPEPLVSVIIQTYQHAAFITECIEGVLKQRVNFNYEIIIGEDNSDDGTREICTEYAEKFPNLIRLFLHHRENVIFLNNAPSGRFNLLYILSKANGKYIAFCEGDDYWTDTNKLQKQVDFLETNPDYVGCFHNTEERYQEGDRASFLYCNYKKAQSIGFKELSFSNRVPTCSIVFLKKYIENLPGWFYKMPMGDWALHLFNTQYGDYWYIPHVMGVHRLTTSSVWALQNHKNNVQKVQCAYDQLIDGFSDIPKMVACLKKGKKRFKLHHKYPMIAKINSYVKLFFKRVN